MHYERCAYCMSRVVQLVTQTRGDQSRLVGLCRKHYGAWEDEQMERRADHAAEDATSDEFGNGINWEMNH